MSEKSPSDTALEKFIEGKIPKELRSNYEHDISMIRGGWYAAMSHINNAAPKWRRETPDESGLWWWWNEDEDSCSIPIEIALSGGTQPEVYFAMAGQYGWSRAQPVIEMGGFWMRCLEPPLPSFEEQDRLKAIARAWPSERTGK